MTESEIAMREVPVEGVATSDAYPSARPRYEGAAAISAAPSGTGVHGAERTRAGIREPFDRSEKKLAWRRGGGRIVVGGSWTAAAISAATVVADDRWADASGRAARGPTAHGRMTGGQTPPASRPARFPAGCLPDRRFPNRPLDSGIERLHGRDLDRPRNVVVPPPSGRDASSVRRDAPFAVPTHQRLHRIRR